MEKRNGGWEPTRGLYASGAAWNKYDGPAKMRMLKTRRNLAALLLLEMVGVVS
jgi:hypothetical protein